MKRISSLLLMVFYPMLSQAIDLDDSGSLTLTGFYNITAGKVLTGSAQGTFGSNSSWQYQQWHCPCTIQNWEYVGVYEKEKGWELDQESLVGVQIKKEFLPNLSATVQLVSRAHNPNQGATPTVDWAYGSWSPTKDSPWTFQLGRFRIPLYYYSDYLYIGYAYPWVRPAPDVYGWPIYAYDGVNVSYKHQIGNSDWAATGQLWYGNYKQNNDAYDTLIYYTTPTNETWKKIWGSYVSLNNGTVDVRGMLMTYRDSTWQDNSDGSRSYVVNNQFTRIAGLSANLDYNNWVVRSEVDRYEQVALPAIDNIYKYALLGVGYTFNGNFTPMLSFSRYRTVLEPIEGRDSYYVGFRWDFMKNTSLKVQYDVTHDKSHYPYPFFGDSKLLSVSVQGVF